MALTFTANTVNPAAGAGGARTVVGGLWLTSNQITIGVAGDYSAGGIPLTPQQLGMSTGVYFGTVQIRTVGGAGTAVNGVLDCTSPAAPKLKLNTASAEAVGAGVAGAVVDVMAYGV